jgi:hypothetical protein
LDTGGKPLNFNNWVMNLNMWLVMGIGPWRQFRIYRKEVFGIKLKEPLQILQICCFPFYAKIRPFMSNFLRIYLDTQSL